MTVFPRPRHCARRLRRPDRGRRAGRRRLRRRASDRKRFVEADLLIEADLAGWLGGTYRWTTGARTWAGGGFGELALLDVVTHEWGHFAGLGHVNGSPELTMFPSVHDGMQTLGRGDMKGVVGLYPAR